jgi:hypothetical protein
MGACLRGTVADRLGQVEDLASYSLKKPEKVAADPLFDVADKLSQEFVRVREVGALRCPVLLLPRVDRTQAWFDRVYVCVCVRGRPWHSAAHCRCCGVVRRDPRGSPSPPPPSSFLPPFPQTREKDREAMLLSLCTTNFKKGVIVFFDRKQAAHRMCLLMQFLGMKAGELHGNMSQQQRLDAYEAFKSGSVDLLMATDLASRGLDIDVRARTGMWAHLSGPPCGWVFSCWEASCVAVYGCCATEGAQAGGLTLVVVCSAVRGSGWLRALSTRVVCAYPGADEVVLPAGSSLECAWGCGGHIVYALWRLAGLAGDVPLVTARCAVCGVWCVVRVVS